MDLTAPRIDLNADLGEERGDDAALFPHLSSANIACGAHAGGAHAMDVALQAAARHDVVVGAHVSYPDREHFGRRDLDIDATALQTSLEQQISALQDQASRFGVTVAYVKPHGALYHRIGTDPVHAGAFLAAVQACDPALDLLVPFSPMLQDLAHGHRCVHEFFADRGYHLDGRLVDRSETTAHIVSVDAIVARTLAWTTTGIVESVEGKSMHIEASSVCLHGDNPYAIAVAQRLHAELVQAGVRIANWARP